MISIRKKFGIATLPVQIVILLWGFILLFVPQNILNTEISVVGTAITLFLIMLPLFLSFFYLKKMRNGWIFVIHSLTNIVQFLLFNHIDKTDKEETEE